jgi:glycosyltransferase involved in cell wall biosynthesis
MQEAKSASNETLWSQSGTPVIAVLLPCYNEELAVGKCVRDFQQALPAARVFVFDNNSKDKTIEVASAAGAEVRREPRQGKGNVVRRMFADIDADIYVMADGDATYDASAAPGMIQLLLKNNLDMVVGCRTSDVQDAYRPGHRFGNAVLTGTLAWMFGRQFTDILSGYRVFSRRFVKSFPALSGGFEIETEITVHALELRAPVGELITQYGARPSGSVSKLNTYRDGIRILLTMVSLFRQERPALFYGVIATALSAFSVVLAIPLVLTYAETGLVPRLPTAVLTTGMMLLAALSAVCGLILDTVTRGRREARRLAYLSLPSARR